MPRGRFLDITTAAYLADPCERPSLSSSIACEIVQRSPLHAWQIHPKLGGLKRDGTAATSSGTLIHALLLGKGEEEIAVLEVDSFRTNVAKELRDAALAAGKCVIKASDYEAANEVADRLTERIAKLGITLDGATEQKIEWTEYVPDEGAILCRAMLDHLVLRYGDVTSATICDLKTVRSGDLRTVQRHILEYGYDLQEAAYRAAVRAVVPETAGRIDCFFLFLEIEPPYDVTPVRLDGQFRSIGESKWDHACRVWARCMRTNTWPGYVDGITPIEPPPWALTG